MKQDDRQDAQLLRWQITEIEKAVEEADAGFFLSEEEAAALMDELSV